MTIDYIPGTTSNLVGDPAEGGAFSSGNKGEIAGANTAAANAATSATAAAASQVAAAQSASDLSAAEANAGLSAVSAASSASSAATSQAACSGFLGSVTTLYNNFEDSYLGAKASEPSTDNDGGALLVGALYYNSTSNILKVWNGTAWNAAAVDGATILLKAQNLADLPSASTARTNLGLGTMAVEAAADYAPLAGATFTGDVTAPEFIGVLQGETVFKAKAGEALSKGDAVYVSGISGNTPVVSKADADGANTYPAFGLASADAALNGTLDVITAGQLKNFDTSGFTLGDTLYLSTTPGVLTATPPTGEGSVIQNMGKVEREHPSVGSILVVGAGRAAATPNLNDGNVFIGNASNKAVTADLGDSAASALSTKTIANLTITSADINGGTIDGVTINGAVGSSNLTFADNHKAIFGNDGNELALYHNTTDSIIEDQGTGSLLIKGTQLKLQSADGEDYAAFTNNGPARLFNNGVEKFATSSTGATVVGRLNTGQIEVTTLRANDGTAAGSIADSTGVVTLASSVLTTADIDGGTVDNVVIGGTTAAAGTFTSLNTTGDMTITSASPEIYLVDTTTAGALGRLQASSEGLGFRSKASDDGGTARFGNHTFSRFDGTNTKTQMVLDANADLRVWNDAGAVRLFWDASHNSSGGGLAIGQAAEPQATLDVHGDALIKERLQIGETQGGTTQAALDIRGNNAESGNFIASVSAGVMNVTSVNGATLAVGDVIYSANAIPANTFIKSFDTGSGGIGTYNLSQSFDLGSVTLRNSPKGSLTASFTNADTSLRAGQPLGIIEFNDADSSNDGAKGFLVCGSQDTTPSSYLAFGTNHTGQGEHAREVARLDEDGNFLLNTIISNSALDHIELRDTGEIRSASLATGTITATSSGSSPLTVNRNDANGTIIDLQANGVTKSVIGYNSNGEAFLRSDLGGFRFSQSGLRPTIDGYDGNDNAADLGTSSNRFKDLYLSSGVYLGGTAAANKLDDYEEGTWTPTYTTAATPPTVSYTDTGGTYTKVGRLVTVTGRIKTASVDNQPGGTDAAGGLRISGLPFVVSLSVTELQNGTLHCGQIKTFTSGRFPAGGYAIRGSSDFALTRRGSSSGNMVNLDVYNAGGSNFTLDTGSGSNEIVFSAVYYTDA